MAKKKEPNESTDPMDIFKNLLSSTVLEFVKGGINEVVSKAKEAIEEAEQKMIQELYLSAIFVVAGISLFLSIAFLMEQYLELTYGWVFFILALIFLVIGLFMKIRGEK